MDSLLSLCCYIDSRLSCDYSLFVLVLDFLVSIQIHFLCVVIIY